MSVLSQHATTSLQTRKRTYFSIFMNVYYPGSSDSFRYPYQSATFVCRTYSRYERWIKGILGEPKQYARFANPRVTNQQQLEKVIVGFCHQQLNRMTPLTNILSGKLKPTPDSTHCSCCSSSGTRRHLSACSIAPSLPAAAASVGGVWSSKKSDPLLLSVCHIRELGIAIPYRFSNPGIRDWGISNPGIPAGFGSLPVYRTNITLGPRLLSMTNRKSHTRFQLVPKSTTLTPKGH